jgi:ketosteroid isomerase-like protein
LTTERPSAGDLLRAYYEALDLPALERLDALFTPDCVWQFPGSTLQGPDAVRAAMAASLATGLSMDHRIGHLVDTGAVAICELVATNRLPAGTFTIAGAVVCEAREGRITRLAAYPDARQSAAFLAALRPRA